MRKRKRCWTGAGILLAGGLLLGGPTCLTAQAGRQLATNTSTRIANLLINALVIQPFEEALDERPQSE